MHLLGWYADGDLKLTPQLVYHTEKCQGFGRQTYVYILNDMKIRHRAWFTGVHSFKLVLFPLIPAVKTYCLQNNLAFKVLLIFGHALGHSKMLGHK